MLGGLGNAILASTFESQTDRAAPHCSESTTGGFTHRIWEFEDAPVVWSKDVGNVEDTIASAPIFGCTAGNAKLVGGQFKLSAVF